MSRRLLRCASLAAVLAALALSACNQEEPKPLSATKPPSMATEGPWTVTHILVGMKGARQVKATRSEAEALALAKSLMQDLANGRPFEELVNKFTDDRDKDGKPNTTNGTPGSYTFTAEQSKNLAPEFAAAMKSLPVGKITPEPVKTMFGYHIIRRDK